MRFAPHILAAVEFCDGHFEKVAPRLAVGEETTSLEPVPESLAHDLTDRDGRLERLEDIPESTADRAEDVRLILASIGHLTQRHDGARVRVLCDPGARRVF